MTTSLNKNIYRQIKESSIPIFYQPWWLDIVCGKENWEVSIVTEKDGHITSVLPYYIPRFLGFRVIRMPPLTPFLGVWLDTPTSHTESSNIFYSEYFKVKKLIDQLPKTIWYHQIHPYQFKYGLPFSQSYFKLSIRCTFIIENEPLDLIFENFHKSLKKNIRKAADSYEIKASSDVNICLKLIKQTFLDRREKFSISEGKFLMLSKYIINKKSGIVLYACDKKTQITVASQFLLWDNFHVYTWFAGLDRKANANRGAPALLIWEAIKIANSMNRSLNFCGSMIAGVAAFNASFGAKLVPVFQIKKCSSKLIEFLKDLIE